MSRRQRCLPETGRLRVSLLGAGCWRDGRRMRSHQEPGRWEMSRRQVGDGSGRCRAGTSVERPSPRHGCRRTQRTRRRGVDHGGHLALPSRTLRRRPRAILQWTAGSRRGCRSCVVCLRRLSSRRIRRGVVVRRRRDPLRRTRTALRGLSGGEDRRWIQRLVSLRRLLVRWRRLEGCGTCSRSRVVVRGLGGGVRRSRTTTMGLGGDRGRSVSSPNGIRRCGRRTSACSC